MSPQFLDPDELIFLAKLRDVFTRTEQYSIVFDCVSGLVLAVPTDDLLIKPVRLEVLRG